MNTYLRRIKWYLWHGNVYRALQVIDDLMFELEVVEPSDSQRKLMRALTDFDRYIKANQTNIPNYGYRYRKGERISTGFVESTVN